MAKIRVRTVIDAEPATVWEDVADIGSHVGWMHDARAIRFTSNQQRGVGTTFDCDTRVGPFTLCDQMEVTEWEPRRAMGIRHSGAVKGSGRFTLRPGRRGRTRFSWEERLSFPWWMGGEVGAQLSKPVLRWIWRRNLRNLKRRFSSR